MLDEYAESAPDDADSRIIFSDPGWNSIREMARGVGEVVAEYVSSAPPRDLLPTSRASLPRSLAFRDEVVAMSMVQRS